MTEQQWLRSTKREAMLEFLRNNGRAGGRKTQLFAAACCRRVWSLLPDERARRVVEVAERFADGRASAAEVGAAQAEARGVLEEPRRARDWRSAERAVLACIRCCIPDIDSDPWLAESGAAFGSAMVASAHAREVARRQGRSKKRQMKAEDAARIAESAAQCALLRCLFGNPFHAAPAAQRSWLTWNDGTVKKLAESFYEEHAFDHLPILADALEEAGCADADMLAHLRGPGPHARGCAALDAVLGKE